MRSPKGSSGENHNTNIITNNNSVKTREAPCTQTWKLWRICCCRYGWYSLLVMPIITSGSLLSLYSSFGCDFVALKVGFTPSNQAWNQSTASLGLFTMYTGVEDGGNQYANKVLDGCEWYPANFEFNFIEGDRTWKVARIMALISGAASMTATLTAWLFLFTPLPASFFWPGLLLPAVLVAFLAEGSKFLMFDTAICRTALWTPEGVNSLPQKAESCSLGSTAVYTIISGCIFFVALMFVCLKAPKKRTLDDSYGRNYDETNNNMQHHYPTHLPLPQYPPQYPEAQHHDPHLRRQSINSTDMHSNGGGQGRDLETALSGVDYASQGSYPRGSDVYIVGGESPSQTSRQSIEGFESVGGRSVRSGKSMKSVKSSRSRGRPPRPELKTVRSESSSGAHSDGSSLFGRDASGREGRDDADAIYHPGGSSILSKQSSGGFDDRMSAAEIAIRRSEKQRISESRVSKIEKMELSSVAEADDLIEKFVSDLNLSFHQDETDIGGGGLLSRQSSSLLDTPPGKPNAETPY